MRTAMAHARKQIGSLDGIGVSWRYRHAYELCEHARKATTVVPKRYRHLSKVSKRCPARTVGHPKVIKGARHVPGPIRELTSLILHDHGPCTAPLTRS